MAVYPNKNLLVKYTVNTPTQLPMRGHRGFLLEVQSHAGMFSPRAANPT